ncbi:LysR family transcriptional regulator [Amycolatopsis silviterrae]|uniref:LysR substrate-binding domain-containing protein n=1 Tax=Amycolatopsis silviterrae TaxID=1656914 RepID=A0ABW5H4C3_9PSEU
MRTFVRVAESGSFSAVARDLGVGQPTVTRHVSELEDALGVAVFSRTTRSISLTEEGRRYYARATEILRLVEQAGQEIEDAKTEASGKVRISCSAFFGVMHLSRLIFAFQDRYPDIRVDFVLTDERSDLIRDGVDLAIQIGPQPDSELRLRPLGVAHQILVAAPAYLARRGTPRSPEDLSGHDVIRRTSVARSHELTLLDEQGTARVATFTPRLRVDHGLAAREALVAGRGVSPVPRWLVDDLLRDGALEVVLPEYRCAPLPLNLLMVPERAEIARVRLLRDFLVEQISGVPGVEPVPRQ